MKPKPIILPHGNKLKGPSRPEDLDLRNYFLLAHKWARRFDKALGGHDESFAVALEGLVKARNRWDPQRGPFEATVALWIRAALGEALNKRQRHDGIAIRDTTHGRSIARKNPQHVFKDSLSYAVVSTETLLAPDGSTIGETLPDPSPGPEELLIEADETAYRQRALNAALAKLPERWRRVVLARASGVLLDDLAEQLGISRERVRQLEHQALDKLRADMTAPAARHGRPKPPAAPLTRSPSAVAAPDGPMPRPASARRLAKPRRKPGKQPWSWVKDAAGQWQEVAWR